MTLIERIHAMSDEALTEKVIMLGGWRKAKYGNGWVRDIPQDAIDKMRADGLRPCSVERLHKEYSPPTLDEDAWPLFMELADGWHIVLLENDDLAIVNEKLHYQEIVRRALAPHAITKAWLWWKMKENK